MIIKKEGRFSGPKTIPERLKNKSIKWSGIINKVVHWKEYDPLVYWEWE